MPFNSIGDLASSLMLNQASTRAKRSLMQLSQELTSGVTTDTRGALRNDLSKQMDWEHSLSANGVLNRTLSESIVKVQAKQDALGTINETLASFANDVSATVLSGSTTATSTLAQSAGGMLDQMLTALNAQAAGQSLFSGSANNRASMASSEEILASIKASLGAPSTVSDVVQGVRDWMSDPVEGFQANAYNGSDESTSPIRLSSNRTIGESLRADHPAFQTILENLVVATLSADETLAPSPASQADLLQVAADGLRSVETQIIELRANLGFVESELVKAKVRVGAEISTTQQIRAETLGIDEYEVASKLQQTELQLEKIYTMTARSAQMSLLEYLR